MLIYSSAAVWIAKAKHDSATDKTGTEVRNLIYIYLYLQNLFHAGLRYKIVRHIPLLPHPTSNAPVACHRTCNITCLHPLIFTRSKCNLSNISIPEPLLVPSAAMCPASQAGIYLLATHKLGTLSKVFAELGIAWAETGIIES